MLSGVALEDYIEELLENSERAIAAALHESKCGNSFGEGIWRGHASTQYYVAVRLAEIELSDCPSFDDWILMNGEKMTEVFTPAQKIALRELADGELHETSASSLASKINRFTARWLVKRGWATRHFVLADGTEISSAARDKYEAYEWRLAYRITDAGREALRAASGGER